MKFYYRYKTPVEFSDMIMFSDGEFLTGLIFDRSDNQKKFEKVCEEKLLSVFSDTVKWLEIYFSGRQPGFTPAYKIYDITEFRSQVIDIMLGIPYGQTCTYGEIADIIADRRGLTRMSSQAVGGAVGWNPICIIVPCHRVIGSDNSLTGYGGGMDNKIALLKLEGNVIENNRVIKERRL